RFESLTVFHENVSRVSPRKNCPNVAGQGPRGHPGEHSGVRGPAMEWESPTLVKTLHPMREKPLPELRCIQCSFACHKEVRPIWTPLCKGGCPAPTHRCRERAGQDSWGRPESTSGPTPTCDNSSSNTSGRWQNFREGRQTRRGPGGELAVRLTHWM